MGMMNESVVIENLKKLREEIRTGRVKSASASYAVRRMNWLGEAIAHLEAQEPRVMTLEEVDALGDNAIVWLECLYFIDGKNITELKPAIYQPDNSSPEEDGYYCVVSSWGQSGFYHKDSYMGDWRCWTARPDEIVRQETPWE